MSVGSQIKQRRTELNMSQETLAEKIGVSTPILIEMKNKMGL